MAKYQHFASGHEIEVGGWDVLGGFLLGPLWYLFRGAIGAGVGMLVLNMLVAFTFWPALIFVFPVNAALAPILISGAKQAAGYKKTG